jgi:hypothetical protein
MAEGRHGGWFAGLGARVKGTRTPPFPLTIWELKIRYLFIFMRGEVVDVHKPFIVR